VAVELELPRDTVNGRRWYGICRRSHERLLEPWNPQTCFLTGQGPPYPRTPAPLQVRDALGRQSRNVVVVLIPSLQKTECASSRRRATRAADCARRAPPMPSPPPDHCPRQTTTRQDGGGLRCRWVPESGPRTSTSRGRDAMTPSLNWLAWQLTCEREQDGKRCQRRFRRDSLLPAHARK
jgi:hypothetical protein